MFTIWPPSPPRAATRRASSREQKKVPSRTIPTTARQPFGESSSALMRKFPAALFTTVVSGPSSASAASNAAATASGSRTSAGAATPAPIAATVSSSGSRRRPRTATEAPSRASSSAIARPSPVPPPVTSATRPSSVPGSSITRATPCTPTRPPASARRPPPCPASSPRRRASCRPSRARPRASASPRRLCRGTSATPPVEVRQPLAPTRAPPRLPRRCRPDSPSVAPSRGASAAPPGRRRRRRPPRARTTPRSRRSRAAGRDSRRAGRRRRRRASSARHRSRTRRGTSGSRRQARSRGSRRPSRPRPCTPPQPPRRGPARRSAPRGKLRAVSTTDAHARELFAPLGSSYDRWSRLLSLWQDPRWRRFLVSRVAVGPGDEVLDVATGTAAVAIELARRTGCSVVGVDQSREMLATARVRVEDAGLAERIRLVEGDAQRLPFADESFDALTFTYLLRYVDDPGATMRELGRTVRSGGTIAMLEFAVPRGVWRPAWELYVRAGLPLAGRAISPGWREVGGFLGGSIREFWRRSPLERLLALWRGAGIEDVHARRLSLGGGIVVWGRRA